MRAIRTAFGVVTVLPALLAAQTPTVSRFSAPGSGSHSSMILRGQRSVSRAESAGYGRGVVVGGEFASITPAEPAPREGLWLQLVSTSEAIAPVSFPVPIPIPATSISAAAQTLSIRTAPFVGSNTGAITVTPSVTIAAGAFSVRFATPSVVGGGPISGTVELDGDAPAGGMTLTYDVTTGQGMRQPPNGTITVGARAATFTATTSVVTTIVADGIQVLASTAGSGSGTGEGRLKILPATGTTKPPIP